MMNKFFIKTISYILIPFMFFHKRFIRDKKREYKKILFIRLDFLGDFLTFLPLAYAFKKRLPGKEINLLLEAEPLKNLASSQGLFHSIYTDGSLLRPDSFRVTRFIKLISFIVFHRKKRYDLVVLSTKHRNAFLHICAYIIAKGYVYGFSSSSGSLLFEKSITENNRVREPRRLLELLKLFDEKYSEDEVHPGIKTPQIKPGAISKKIDDFIGIHKYIVIVQPGGKRPSNRWMPDRFNECMKKIHGFNPDIGFLMPGSPDEINIAEKIMDTGLEEYCMNLTGKLDIDDYFNIVSKSNYMICNDSGPMHLSTMLKIPTIALFGRGVYDRWCPEIEFPNFISIYKRLECAPCWKWECDDHRCMKAIEVDEVVEAFKKIFTTQNTINGSG